MKAWILTKYGSTDVLKLRDVDTPVPAADQVLIRVRAFAVNDWDWCLMRGKPLFMRLLCGLRGRRFGFRASTSRERWRGWVRTLPRCIRETMSTETCRGADSEASPSSCAHRSRRWCASLPGCFSLTPRLCHTRRRWRCRDCSTRGSSRPGRRCWSTVPAVAWGPWRRRLPSLLASSSPGSTVPRSSRRCARWASITSSTTAARTSPATGAGVTT